MAALSAERNTVVLAGGALPENLSFPIKDNVKIYKGALVVLDAGYLAPGRVATTLVAVGRAEQTVDNTIVGHAAGLFQVETKQGVIKFANSTAGDLIAQADVGAVCFIVDDQTVAKTNGSASRSAAGKVVRVDSDGVFVKIGL
jgi:hypothetical protein